jgi:paraquat-inducible protein A
MYIPANLLAVTQTSSIFESQSDTILSGIVYLWMDGSWLLAMLVFVASIVVPLFKLLGLSYLLISVHRRSRRHARRRTELYRALELIGRWSMLDVYVITWLAALVHIQTLANITPGPGAMAFGAVVVLTMLATQSFDPRLIWDAIDAPRQSSTPPGHHLEPEGQS